MRDPETNQLKYHAVEIEDIFLYYYKKLYTKTSSTKVEAMEHFLNDLDLLRIGKKQNDCIISRFFHWKR